MFAHFLLFFWFTRVNALNPPLVVMITGSSSGIGKTTALEFAKYPEKYKVWATMRSTDRWDSKQPNIQVAEMDVTSETSIMNTVTKIIEDDGRIDIVVNNAGYGIVGTLESVDIDDAKVIHYLNPL
jgi:NADP-dependent 3-hydroxy acid dehydrogenase YdfG